MRRLKNIFVLVLIFLMGAAVFAFYKRFIYEQQILNQVIARLQADSRVAQVLVTGVNYNEENKKTYTTIKFLEYDVSDKPLEPRYFTFAGNIIQFQSLVVRFDDSFVRSGDKLRGKSIFLFWKIFMLDDKAVQVYDLAKINEIPRGYKITDTKDKFEEKLWKNFWDYALDPQKAQAKGIKNAQIEAPGTIFVPGNLYTIKIEHDGGLRIDATRLPEILKGEAIPL